MPTALDKKVLGAVKVLEPEAYGLSIWRYLDHVEKKNHSIHSLYASLERMVEQGFLEAHMGEATKERGWKRKRLFKITENGKTMLAEEELKKRRKAIYGKAIPCR